MRPRSLALGLALLVAAGLVAGWLGNRETRLAVALAPGLPESTPAAAERRWQPFPGEKIASLALGGDLHRPALLTAGGRDLYLVDYEDLRIKAVDADLREVRVLGPSGGVAAGDPGSPPGPGEWRTVQPMDLAVAGDRLWVSDPQTKQVLALTPDGALDRRITLDEQPFRLAAHGDGQVTVLVPGAPDHVFETFDTAPGDLAATPSPRRFGRLVEPDLQMPWTLDGFLLADGRGGVVYALRNRGLLAAFDDGGRLRYLVEPVGAAPEPVLIEERGRLSGDPDQPFALLDAALHDGTVYVLTTEDGTAQADGVIDLYSAADGSYHHSWRLPTVWLSLAVTDRRLHALTRDAVTAYARPDDGVE